MKEFLTILLALACAISMSACGIGKKSESASVDEGFNTGNKLSTDKLSTDSSEQSSPDNTDTDGSEEADNAAAASNEQLDASDFKEMTAVDNDECSIKLLSMKPGEDGTYVFDVSLENKSDSVTYMYYAIDSVINGVRCLPIMGSVIEPGKTEQAEISFNNFDLPADRNGASNTKIDFSDIRITFVVQDFNDGFAEPAANETITIYPFGKDKANTYIRHSQATDRVIMTNDNVTVSVIDYEYHTDWSYVAKLYIQNHTDKPITLFVSDCRINEAAVNPNFLVTIPPSSSAFQNMEWNVLDLSGAGIDKINFIEMVLSACEDEEGNNVLQSENVYIDASSIEFKVGQSDYAN